MSLIMPQETSDAINWALQQTVVIEEMGISYPVTKDTPSDLVDKVRDYFNTNDIEYSTFSYENLVPFL